MVERPRVLFVSPHPDDAAIYPGGTLAKCAQSGADVYVLNVTSGEKGKTLDTLAGKKVKESEIRKIREREEIEAARLLGVAHLGFLHFPDMGVSELIIPELTQTIISYNPHVILALSEAGTSYEPHKADHSWTGIATYLTILKLLSRNPNPIPAFVRYLTYTLPNVEQRFTNFAEIDTPDQELVKVDIEGQLEQKLKAIKAHASQSHLTNFFKKAGLLDLRSENFRERISIGSSAAGTGNILFGLGLNNRSDNIQVDPLPLPPNSYKSNHNIYDHTLARVERSNEILRWAK